jgi:hypothetical protein
MRSGSGVMDRARRTPASAPDQSSRGKEQIMNLPTSTAASQPRDQAPAGKKDSADKIAMDSADKAAVIIGLSFLVLIGFMYAFTIKTMKTVNDFLMVWTAVGPIVGVVIGSIPAYFFRSMANTANDRADQMAVEMAHMGTDSNN